ncbi:L,D-transpeptidase [Aciditerrimonas ferrireducens]|uniref:L,D-transpeptidase n=1 Tax=Aciditerrimonas ferrireducens TaxID=667306 RepID=A0ABV6C5H6_9ACTN
MTEVLSRPSVTDPGGPGGRHLHRGRSAGGTAWYRQGRWLLLGAGVLVVAGVVVLLAVVLWPRASLRRGTTGLATLELRGSGTSFARASATVEGRTVPLVDRRGQLVPTAALPAGRPVTVVAVARVPGWLSWLAGSTRTSRITLTTPAPRVASQVVLVQPGAHPTVSFQESVGVVRWSGDGTGGTVRLAAPSRSVTLDLALAAQGAASVQVEAQMPWETSTSPQTVTVFAGQGAMAFVTPAPGTPDLTPGQPIVLSFSEPLRTLFGNRQPVITVAKADTHPAGHWREEGPNTLAFVPAPGAIWPNQTLDVELPRSVEFAGTEQGSGRQVQLETVDGSVLRAQQLLASLGYLPLTWTPSPGQSTPTTLAAQDALATDPPSGSFGWRWANTPSGLQALWVQGSDSVMTRGAIMNFEHVEGLDPVGFANPLLWPTLAQAALEDKVNPDGYSWVDVTESLPEQLVLWHNGQVVLTSLANTGIPQTPTDTGTYPVYLRLQFQIMRGVNPDGTPYADPVHWISYFNGGDAVHGFVRASYGFPQSLGCVELPVPTAKVVWPYLHIGSLVTVQSQPLSV